VDPITDVTRDCFDAIIQLRRTSPAALPAAPALQQRFRKLVDALLVRAGQHGFARADADDIAYAVVALADEVVLSCSDELRATWASQSLQLHYFHENVAGEAFFTRLDQLRKDPRRAEVLRAYHVALGLGFQGKYRVRGGDLELMNLTEDVAHLLERGRRFDPEVLAPHGERPDDPGARGHWGGRLLLGVAAGLLLAAVLLYAGLRVSIGATAEGAARRIQAAAQVGGSR
jgi:type VI secretion system protein ImpK